MQVLNVPQLKIKHHHQNEFVFIEALYIPVIWTPFKMKDISSAQENRDHLSKLKLDDFDDVSSKYPVGLLVGVDYYFCFLSKKVIKKSCGPVACEIILSWVLDGPLSIEHSFSSSSTTHSMCCTVERSLEVNEDLN